MDKKMLFDQYKFRASEIANFVNLKGGITEKQSAELIKLYEKREAGKITARQEVRLAELEQKKNLPPVLSEGAKNWLQKKFLSEIFGIEPSFDNKYLVKGRKVEAQSIELLSSWRGEKLKKNTKRYANEWITGEPDVIDDNMGVVIDIKSSWDVFTFPMFAEGLPDTAYYWQMQAYMWLTGYEVSQLAYVLTDTPEWFINDELRKWAWLNGHIDVPDEVEQAIRRRYTYDHIPLENRIRTFMVFRNERDIERIKEAVAQARAYMFELENKMQTWWNADNDDDKIVTEL